MESLSWFVAVIFVVVIVVAVIVMVCDFVAVIFVAVIVMVLWSIHRLSVVLRLCPTVWNALPDYLRNPTISIDVFA